MRIMLLSDNRKTAQCYADAAKEIGSHRLSTVKNIAQALERLFRDPFDALVSEDPSVLLPRIQNCPVLWPNHIFLLTHETVSCDYYPDVLTFCFSADTDPKTVLLRIGMFPKGHRKRNDIHTAISFFLQQAGVPVFLSGFDYLREAIRLILIQKSAVDVRSVNDIYEIVAAEAGTNPFIAEHAMRHAIETAWIRADMPVLEQLFGYTVRSDRGVPSNAAFLFRAADQIQLNEKGEQE